MLVPRAGDAMNYSVFNRKLLIVEDDERLKSEMAAYFSRENAVFTASDVDEAIELLTKTAISTPSS